MAPSLPAARPARPAVWSHRGRVGPADGFQENTVAAFQAASATGADGIELDVWRTLDGQWVVHHDRNSVAGPLDALARSEVPAGIPSLGDALSACSVGTVNVELKVPPEATPAEAAALGEELAGSLALAGGPLPLNRLVLSSFSADAAGAALGAVPALRVGLLVEAAVAGEWAAAAAAGYWALHVPYEVLGPAEVAAVHDHGLYVVAWTVDEPAHMERLVGAGVDVLITDTPLVALVAVRGCSEA